MKPIKQSKTKQKGLGDSIKAVTEFLGITQCDECKRRQALFNKLFPYKDYTRDFTESELEVLKRTTGATRWSSDDVGALFKMYNEILKPKSKLERCQCPGILLSIIEQLNKLL